MDIEVDENSRFKTTSSLMYSDDNYDLDIDFNSNPSSLKAHSVKDLSESPALSTGSNKSKRKYVKKTASKFLDSKLTFDTFRSAQLQTLPMYTTIKDPLQFILIGGDFLYNMRLLDSPYSISKMNSQVLIAENEESLSIYKDIVEVSKTDRFIQVKLTNKINGIIDFRKYISVINELMIAVSGECHLDMLIKFQEYIDRCQVTVHRIIQLYPNYTDLLAKQQLRAAYIKQLGKTSLDTRYKADEDYLGIGLSMINFHNRVPTLENICFNKQLVQLIGTDFDQLQAYFMRRGLKEFFDFETRILIQQQHIRAILNRQNECFVHPFTLITFDDYRISCRIQLESLFTEMPDELKYDINGEDPFDLHEGGFIMKLLITDDQINQIYELRNAAKSTNDASSVTSFFPQEDDICYTMQSQYLVEKYYPGDLKKILRSSEGGMNGGGEYSGMEEESQEKQEKSDPYREIRCKFKPIDHSRNQS